MTLLNMTGLPLSTSSPSASSACLQGSVWDGRFSWHGYSKPLGGFFVGTSPELDMAVFTVCFFARPDDKCPISLAGRQLQVRGASGIEARS